MKLAEIQTHLKDLKKEYYAIGRTLNFDEWLTAQCVTLNNERNQWEEAHAKLEEKLRIQYDAELEAFKKSFEQRLRADILVSECQPRSVGELNTNHLIGRVNALEEWLTEYRDQLKKENAYHKNTGIINAINELLNENS